MAANMIETVEMKDFGGLKMPSNFYMTKEKIEHMDVRDNDVWVTSYPKSGTTWCQELVWLVANNLDYEGAKIYIDQRFPFIEGNAVITDMTKFHKKHNIDAVRDEEMPDFIKLLNNDTEIRFIKSHLPWDFLPRQITDGIKNPKVIHIIRNPKQVAISYYHHSSTILPSYIGNLNDFIERFIEGKVLYGDYFFNVLSYWKRRHLPNLLILTYEEMSSDLLSVIKKVCDFLNKSYAEEDIKKLAEYLSFEKMKANTAVNRKHVIINSEIHFMRKGSTDSYKTELTIDMIAKLDKWINQETKGTGLPYEQEIK